LGSTTANEMIALKLERLPKPELITEPVAEALRTIASFPEVKFIIVFGSRAAGDADDRSDVDVSVSAPGISMRRWLEIVRVAEEPRTLLRVSVVRFDTSPAELQRRNLADGIVIYGTETFPAESR
jgi:predicted nucleotidyltransferase